MDRFIDEQDSSRDRSSSPNFYSLMFGNNADGRKGLSLYPGAKSQLNLGGNSENNGASDLSSHHRESSAPNPTSTAVENPMGSDVATSAQTTINSSSSSNGSAENPSHPPLLPATPNPRSPQQWFHFSVLPYYTPSSNYYENFLLK